MLVDALLSAIRLVLSLEIGKFRDAKDETAEAIKSVKEAVHLANTECGRAIFEEYLAELSTKH